MSRKKGFLYPRKNGLFVFSSNYKERKKERCLSSFKAYKTKGMPNVLVIKDWRTVCTKELDCDRSFLHYYLNISEFWLFNLLSFITWLASIQCKEIILICFPQFGSIGWMSFLVQFPQNILSHFFLVDFFSSISQ